ncbi:hypothetical protein [Streptomyces alfalfae]
MDSEQRQHLIARGLLLDWAANSAPTDNAAVAAAAHAGHALRVFDRRAALSDLRARAYLRDAFRDLDDQEVDDAHPRDCAGRCYGTGEVLTVFTWEHHGDGIYTPVHQEPVLCCFGSPTAHAPDCATCKGHGFTYPPGYRELCLDGRSPDREPEAALTPQEA